MPLYQELTALHGLIKNTLDGLNEYKAVLLKRQRQLSELSDSTPAVNKKKHEQINARNHKINLKLQDLQAMEDFLTSKQRSNATQPAELKDALDQFAKMYYKNRLDFEKRILHKDPVGNKIERKIFNTLCFISIIGSVLPLYEYSKKALDNLGYEGKPLFGSSPGKKLNQYMHAKLDDRLMVAGLERETLHYINTLERKKEELDQAFQLGTKGRKNTKLREEIARFDEKIACAKTLENILKEKGKSPAEKILAYDVAFQQAKKTTLKTGGYYTNQFLKVSGYLLASAATLGLYPLAKAMYSKDRRNTAAFWRSDEQAANSRVSTQLKAAKQTVLKTKKR